MELVYDDKSRRELICRMYQDIFHDPQTFADYYFDVVYPKNQVLMAWDGSSPVGMIHLNPYRMKISDCEFDAHYIVAVATKKEARRKGVMRNMLFKVLNDMAERGEPFTYLMPADRAYYEPFDFVFVMDWTETEIIGAEGIPAGEVRPFREADTEKVLEFLNRQIQSYDIYTVMDAAYLRQAAAEAESQGGSLMVWKEHGRISGVFAYGREDNTVYVRLGFAGEEESFLDMLRVSFPGKKIEISAGCLKKGTRVPKIMFRITCLEALCRCLKGRTGREFILTIKDPIIEKNSGTFLFSPSKDGTKIQKTEEKAEGELTIGELSKAVFGYEGEEILEMYPCLKELIPMDAVYITEEV
ncbi:GNAT family N-acetyltransferase [Anaerostipes sp.]|uniref:GNAT family N-acetyltransferase n=1 Tax=Anaerostipes sp. TaxID=1872530 RepID=UPI0025BECCBF|nr:GNAT family N-acetyltransferase [Anaerostipes sp.]MBS7007554.1 GNAT family N-acetyltransferase [Anaerostipes sp.]